MVAVTGLDHVWLSVSDLAVSRQYYDVVLGSILEFSQNEFELDDVPHLNYFNRHYGIILRPAPEPGDVSAGRPGLHHLCLRVDTIDDVKAVASAMQAAGLNCSEAARYPKYAPDYWAVYFNDPDNIHLEVTNFREERRQRFFNPA
ncbi:MAG: VOC family protein [Pseudomonadales bacterium]|nr:VOC family protein [Pseudomonadales bacterium]